MERTIRSLTRHYPRRDEAVIQVLTVLERFQGVLNPEQSDFTYDDGRVELLLSLTGVLPIPIQANVYHCPIVFWLPLDFPSTPPIVFILPSETLAVRKGKNVDAGGRVTVQYIEQWSRKSEGCSLSALIDELIPTFSARYPVTTVQPKAPSRPNPAPTPSTSSAASVSTVRPASSTDQPFPPRPPPPPNSSQSRNENVTSPPPRPPLPPQSFADGRPASLLADSQRRPLSTDQTGNSATASSGMPPRPPLPPGSMSLGPMSGSTLPPGPPPGYRTSGGSHMPPYSAPQRAATVAFGSGLGHPSMPLPPSFPLNSQSPLPPQPPVPHVPHQAPLAPPVQSQQPNDPSRRFSSIHPNFPSPQPPQPPAALPLPGAFSPSPDPPRPRTDSDYSQRRESHPSSNNRQQIQPPRPYSPAASTVRAYSPTPSSVAPPTTAYLSSPPRQSREQPHSRQDSYDSPNSDPRYSSNRRVPERPYSPSASSVHSYHPPPPAQQSQPQIRPPQPPIAIDPSHRSYSPSPSSAATPYSPQSHQPSSNTRSQSDWSDRHPPHSSAVSVASASEYGADYGSYMPPAMSPSVSAADEEEEERVIQEMRGGTERLSTGARRGEQRSSYEPYQSASNDRHFPPPPRPPSEVFEPVVESRARAQQYQQPQQPYSRNSIDTSRTGSNNYQNPPPPPSISNASSHSTLPPPVGAARQNGYAYSPAPIPRQAMRTTPRGPVKPSVNILDSADEDLESPSSVVPTSPSSISTRAYGTNPLRSHPSNVPPPIPPNPALLALRTRLHSKLSSSLASLHSEVTTTHLEPLSLMHSDLQKAVPAIEDEMARLRAVRDVCMNVRDRYKEVVEEGEKRMGEYERRGEGVDVDEIICGSTVVYTQLLDLVAEDAALEDTIYALGRALNSGTANIDLEQFLKRVRALAREQFIKRATINKILLGLAIRRERNQQRDREASQGGGRGGTLTGSRDGSGQGGRGTPNEG
ncbi:hypothetical protein JCM5353_005856 [Sporobolomyces roseus]